MQKKIIRGYVRIYLIIRIIKNDNKLNFELMKRIRARD